MNTTNDLLKQFFNSLHVIKCPLETKSYVCFLQEIEDNSAFMLPYCKWILEKLELNDKGIPFQISFISSFGFNIDKDSCEKMLKLDSFEVNMSTLTFWYRLLTLAKNRSEELKIERQIKEDSGCYLHCQLLDSFDKVTLSNLSEYCLKLDNEKIIHEEAWNNEDHKNIIEKRKSSPDAIVAVVDNCNEAAQKLMEITPSQHCHQITPESIVNLNFVSEVSLVDLNTDIASAMDLRKSLKSLADQISIAHHIVTDGKWDLEEEGKQHDQNHWNLVQVVVRDLVSRCLN